MNMERISIFNAICSCSKYRKLSNIERKKLQQERLNRMVRFAKVNSSYYAALYQEVSEDFSLSDLPTVNKTELMAHWNDWVTDRDVTLSEIQHFMEDLDHIGRKWNGKYLIYTTSGSTGNPLINLCDTNCNNVTTAISALRSYARSEDMKAFIKRGGKSVGIYADSGFYLGNSSIRSRLLKMPWKKRQIGIVSALAPTEQIVEKLNTYQPAMLGGYPSNLELLIEEQKSGRLHISPVVIMTGGEYLSEQLRSQLKETFHCYVQTSYACTEGGTVACECRQQHLHINDDWVIIEPVDKNNRPVPAGVQSDKLLLTNLFNFSQPFIRYEVTDRIILHNEQCACGNPSPWIEIEGRNDDVITLTGEDKVIHVPPLAIYATLKEVHCLRRFQLVVYSENHIELRLDVDDSISKENAFAKANDALREFFHQYNIRHIDIKLSDNSPQQDPGSGKFKHIINWQMN